MASSAFGIEANWPLVRASRPGSLNLRLHNHNCESRQIPPSGRFSALCLFGIKIFHGPIRRLLGLQFFDTGSVIVGQVLDVSAACPF